MLQAVSRDQQATIAFEQHGRFGRHGQLEHKQRRICHRQRAPGVQHMIGGRLNRFASSSGETGLSYAVWKMTSWLNERHMLFAWVSLFWVMFTDFYIWAVCNGWITDLNSWSQTAAIGQ